MSGVIELEAFLEVPVVARDFRHRGNIQRKLATRLCHEMVLREAIDFSERLAEDEFFGTDLYRARVKVVAPDAATWLAEKQEGVARKVVDLAVAAIQGWGSYYGDTHISKDQAERAIRQALTEARNKP